MSFDYLAEDRRFLTSAGLSLFWGSICLREIVKKRFKALFMAAGAASSFMAYDALSQFNAHRVYSFAKSEHHRIRGKKIALIAQTQKLVPISSANQLLQINKIRTLLQFGLTPYIVTINDFDALHHAIRKASSENEVKALWIRADYNDKNLYFSYGEINPFPELSVLINNELSSDTPVIIERDFEAFLFTQANSSSPASTVSGKDALEAALNNFNRMGQSFKAEK